LAPAVRLVVERPVERAMPLAVDLLASRRRYDVGARIEPINCNGVEPAHEQSASPVIVERGRVKKTS